MSHVHFQQDHFQWFQNNFIIDVKKKNEYLPEDEERSEEGKCVEDATDSKTETKSSVNSEHRCILSALLSMTCTY